MDHAAEALDDLRGAFVFRLVFNESLCDDKLGVGVSLVTGVFWSVARVEV
jgi:hypothetical protein